MKLTEKKIKQIILEELESIMEKEVNLADPSSQKQQPQEPKMKSDVELVAKQLPRIADRVEYEQLLNKVLEIEFKDPQGKTMVLKKMILKIREML
tara:strand:+ start:8798 stop:9082 length:285 start_codon:yes stop_codon:yes gene_type:complete